MGYQPKRSNLWVALGCVIFAGATFSIPYSYKYMKGDEISLQTKDTPLTRSQIQRGPFLNSGSRDCGPDPDWDWENQLYKGKPVVKK